MELIETVFKRQKKIDKILQDAKIYTCSCFYDDHIIHINKIKVLSFGIVLQGFFFHSCYDCMFCNLQMHVPLYGSNNSKRLEDFFVCTSYHGKYSNCLKEKFHLAFGYSISEQFYIFCRYFVVTGIIKNRLHCLGQKFI